MEATHWKAASAYVIGRSHEKDHTVCQDRTYTIRNNDLQVIALADGAGSAPLSHIGAEFVTTQASHYILERFNDLLNTDMEQVVEELYHYLISGLAEEAIKQQCNIAELASTLLLVIADDQDYIVGHIGDGMVTALTSSGLRVISDAENGEYANATFFLTSKNAQSHLRIAKGKLDDIEAFHLMSDGTTASMYRKADQYISPALTTMSGWLQEHDEDIVNQALEQNLMKSIRMKTFDDCSIALMVRKKSDSSVVDDE